MHEGTLIKELVNKVVTIAQLEEATRVTAVRVKVGEFSHVSPDHLREHFDYEARGTVAEGAHLEMDLITDTTDPDALEIVLDSIDIDRPEQQEAETGT